ncbi:MAG: histidine kinase dimerization/phospho-acceptor domain-containing protein, partial [Pirellulaceae bacterium]
MDLTTNTSASAEQTPEDAARRMVQMLLLDEASIESGPVLDFVSGLSCQEQAWGPWTTALSRLVERLIRLKQLETDFDDALVREKLASMRELAYGASHEINNPLANISSRAQTLLDDESDPQRRRKLATINSQAFRAHEMIADMMLFA